MGKVEKEEEKEEGRRGEGSYKASPSHSLQKNFLEDFNRRKLTTHFPRSKVLVSKMKWSKKAYHPERGLNAPQKYSQTTLRRSRLSDKKNSGKHRDVERTTASPQLSLSALTALALTWQSSGVYMVTITITTMSTQPHPVSKGQADWAFCFSASTNPETHQSAYCYSTSGGSDFPYRGMSGLLCQNLVIINTRLSAHGCNEFLQIIWALHALEKGWD